MGAAVHPVGGGRGGLCAPREPRTAPKRKSIKEKSKESSAEGIYKAERNQGAA